MARTYYDELELEPDASPLDIKKAYRRLALLYHPDRISNDQNKAEATERFKAISHAFQVLSDPNQRAQYDASLLLRSPSSSRPSSSTTHVNSNHGSSPHYYHSPPFVDPFAQFDHLFRSDAFFRQAFVDIEQEFAQRFPQSTQQSSTTQQQQRRSQNEGWFPWLLRQCGIQFSMTTYSTGLDGSVTARSYVSSNQQEYTDKRTRTYLDQTTGHTITVRSMEQNGNVLEEYFDNGTLIQRRVNGQVQQIEPQQQHGRTTIGPSGSSRKPVVMG